MKKKNIHKNTKKNASLIETKLFQGRSHKHWCCINVDVTTLHSRLGVLCRVCPKILIMGAFKFNLHLINNEALLRHLNNYLLFFYFSYIGLVINN